MRVTCLFGSLRTANRERKSKQGKILRVFFAGKMASFQICSQFPPWIKIAEEIPPFPFPFFSLFFHYLNFLFPSLLENPIRFSPACFSCFPPAFFLLWESHGNPKTCHPENMSFADEGNDTFGFGAAWASVVAALPGVTGMGPWWGSDPTFTSHGSQKKGSCWFVVSRGLG